MRRMMQFKRSTIIVHVKYMQCMCKEIEHFLLVYTCKRIDCYYNVVLQLGTNIASLSCQAPHRLASLTVSSLTTLLLPQRTRVCSQARRKKMPILVNTIERDDFPGLEGGIRLRSTYVQASNSETLGSRH